MPDTRPALRCSQVTIQNYGGRQNGGNRQGGKGEEKKKFHSQQVEVKTQNQKLWKIYIHLYGHRVQ